MALAVVSTLPVIEAQGPTLFVDDIYGHDRALDAALQHGYPYPVRR